MEGEGEQGIQVQGTRVSGHLDRAAGVLVQSESQGGWRMAPGLLLTAVVGMRRRLAGALLLLRLSVMVIAARVLVGMRRRPVTQAQLAPGQAVDHAHLSLSCITETPSQVGGRERDRMG